MFKQKKLYLVFDNVKYNNNIGPIFRLADAFKVKKVFLCRDNKLKFKPNQLEIIKKSSRGASILVDWELRQDTLELVRELKANNVHILSVDLKSKKFIDDPSVDIRYPLALVFGSESNGISRNIIDLSDEAIKLPMYGKSPSLNVASCVAIVTYKIREL